MRFEGAPDMTTKMLCGLIESVKSETPTDIIEQLIDIVIWMYLTLRLQKFRTVLINSSSSLPPKYRIIVASSLVVDGYLKNESMNKKDIPNDDDVPPGLFSWKEN